MGELWTQPRAMETQRAGVILKVYEEVGKVPEEELVTELFQETAVMHSTDLCPGMLAMLRGHRQLNPAWDASHFHCGMHRIRTAELNALKLDARTDSFWMNFSLSLRVSSAMWEIPSTGTRVGQEGENQAGRTTARCVSLAGGSLGPLLPPRGCGTRCQ